VEVVSTHIEEIYGRSLDDHKALERELMRYRITFAYGGMTVALKSVRSN